MAARTAAAVVGLALVVSAAALLFSPITAGDVDGDEAKALVAIRAALFDPSRVLRNWDDTAGSDPCSWAMVTCYQGQVSDAPKPLR
nr:unnamed protein product [Digitaria exilis]